MTDEAELNVLWELIANAGRAALIVPMDKAIELRDMNERATSIGPFMDPTAFMRLDKLQVRDNRELLEAFIKFRRALENLRPVQEATQP